MKALVWIATGVCMTAVAWTIAPDLRRYLKMHSM
jgi:hypothetical protein